MNIRYIISLLAFTSTICSVAQPKIKFTSTQQLMGASLWKSPVIASFEFTNDGDDPLTVTSVRTSCGCTAASWTKEPVARGEKGVVSVAFDGEMLGHFEKSVQVFTNAGKEPHYLTMVGDVAHEIVNYEGSYTFRVGEVLFNTDNVEFDNVNKGDQPQQVISLINTGKRPYRPTLMHLPKYLTAQAIPEEVRGGRTGKIILTLDTKGLPDMGLTKTSIYVSRYPGDKVSMEREVSVSAVLLPAFSQLSPEQMTLAPSLGMDKDSVILDLEEGKTKAKDVVILTNNGRSNLKISALQVFNSAINVELNKQEIKPGESAKLKIAIVAKYLKKNKGRLRVMLITNDPHNPKVFIDIKTGKK